MSFYGKKLIVKSTLLIFLASPLCLFLSCSRQEKPAAVETNDEKPPVVKKKRMKVPEFVVQEDSSRIVVATGTIALRDTSRKLSLVFWRDTSSSVPEYSDMFSHVDCYSPVNDHYVQTSSLTVPNGVGFEYRDVTGDGVNEIIIHVSTGGNDAVTSEGLLLFSATASGELTKLFERSDGAPVLRDLNDDGIEEILVEDEYIGKLPHRMVIEFTSDIYSFDGKRYVRTRDERLAETATLALFEQAKRDYETLRTPQNDSLVKEALNRYQAAARVLVLAHAMGDPRLAQAFWNIEGGALSTMIPEEYTVELESLARHGIQRGGQ